MLGVWPRVLGWVWMELAGAGHSFHILVRALCPLIIWRQHASVPRVSVLPSLGRILGPGSPMTGEGVWTEEQGTGRARIFLCLLDLVSLSLVPLHGRKIRFEIFFPWDFSQLFFSRLSCLGNRCLECGCVVHGAESACSDLLAAF